MDPDNLAAGKLPPVILERVIKKISTSDSRVKVGPGTGRDCAVVEFDQHYLVYSTDPITFTGENIGWYCVQINANDIATSGATPRWFLVTYLFPEGKTTPQDVDEITNQINQACDELHISVIGGHTEITVGLDRPILVGTMIGEVEKNKLVTADGIRAGDIILLTKGIPIEAVAILSRDFTGRLAKVLLHSELETAQNYIYKPGISVLRDASIATRNGHVTAMHDPTEGGVASALWELAQASKKTLIVNPANIPVSAIAKKVCKTFHLNPLAAIASGALIITAPPEDSDTICRAMLDQGIECAEIGEVEEGSAKVWTITEDGRNSLIYPEVDAVTKVYKNDK